MEELKPVQLSRFAAPDSAKGSARGVGGGAVLARRDVAVTYLAFMYPPPTGTDLSAVHARELDDTFLSSDPLSYFRSRIAALVAWDERNADAPQHASAWEEGAPAASAGSLRQDMAAYLRRAASERSFSRLDVDAQIAADAVAVRHHAAEALLRLAAVRLHPAPLPVPGCVWAEVAASPNQVEGVLARLQEGQEMSEDPPEMFFCAVVPPADRDHGRTDADTVAGVNVFVEWLVYGSELLTPGAIDINAAHNKTKHGLAVRARADMRMSFVKPNPEQDLTALPVSTFDAAVDIFDQPVLELLATPKVNNHRQGLELTQLHLNTAAILAEAEMLAMTHGAMFHVAATEHFADRDDLEDPSVVAPAHPGYPSAGPVPTDIDPDGVAGMRFPMATPPGGGAPARPAGIGFRNGHFVTLTSGPKISGQIVDG